MKVVIDIPKYVYDMVKECKEIIDADNEIVAKAIISGTPLPKDHGRLIDADILEIYVHEIPDKYCDVKQVVDYDVIKDASTIIEADEG